MVPEESREIYQANFSETLNFFCKRDPEWSRASGAQKVVFK